MSKVGPRLLCNVESSPVFTYCIAREMWVSVVAYKSDFPDRGRNGCKLTFEKKNSVNVLIVDNKMAKLSPL